MIQMHQWESSHATMLCIHIDREWVSQSDDIGALSAWIYYTIRRWCKFISPDLLTSEPQCCWDCKIRLCTFNWWRDISEGALHRQNEDAHIEYCQHWFRFWIVRLIRGARSSTVANGTNWWRWLGELTCKVIVVISAISWLKRSIMPIYYPVGSPMKQEGG